MNPYDAWAQVYDHLTENVEYEARSAYISGFFLQYGIEPGAQVLDLACGTGSLTRVLAAVSAAAFWSRATGLPGWICLRICSPSPKASARKAHFIGRP